MFGTIVDKIQNLLSRSFLLGNFFPVLIFAVINFIIAWFGVEEFAVWLGTKWPTDPTTSSTVSAFALVIVAIVAFILAPLIPLFRRILEGQILLPKKMYERRKQNYTAESQRLREKSRTARADYVSLDRAIKKADEKFKAARSADGPRKDLDPVWLANAKSAVAALLADMQERERRPVERDRLPDLERVKDAITPVAKALAKYPLQPGLTDPAASIADEIDTLQGDLLRRLKDARDFANHLLQVADSDARTNFVPFDIRATRVANSRVVMESYPLVAYGVEYEFLWPRVRMVLPNDKTIAAAVETATAQLDFAVLMTALSAVSALIWIPVLGLTGKSILLYGLIGLLLPALTLFFYQLVHETQKAFGSVMETAIDCLRFDLLKALRQPLPGSLGAEQKTWENLQISLYSGVDQIRYRHPKP